MSTITAAIGPYTEVAHGDRRKAQILRAVPNPWKIFTGEITKKELVVCSDMQNFLLFLLSPAVSAVEAVWALTTDPAGRDSAANAAVGGGRNAATWARAIFPHVSRTDRLTHVIVVTGQKVIIFRRSGEKMMNDVLDAALYA